MIELNPVLDGRVEISSAEGVALLRLNRPDKMNAFDGEQIRALQEALEWLRRAEDVRVAVLTGNERAFSAGGDISTFDALDADTGLAFTRLGYDLLRPLETGEKPVIAAVEGFCLAGGLEVALACDFIVAGGGAKFGFGEVDLGLIPGWGGTVRLPRAIPVRRARQMILTSERIGAEEAYRLGLVNEVLPSGDALDRALELAAAIARQPATAVRAAKMVAEQAADGVPADAAHAAERSVCAALFATEELHSRVREWTERAQARRRG